MSKRNTSCGKKEKSKTVYCQHGRFQELLEHLPMISCRGATRGDVGGVATPALFMASLTCARLEATLSPHLPNHVDLLHSNLSKSPPRCLPTTIRPLPFEISSCTPETDQMLGCLNGFVSNIETCSKMLSLFGLIVAI